jgi:sugar lactone lactonase YvrE
MRRVSCAPCVLAAAAIIACAGPGHAPGLPDKPPAARAAIGTVELFAKLYDYMPTGVAVSREGRVFASFPRWDDGILYTVAEVSSDGTAVPYPSRAFNQPDPDNPQGSLYSVQSVVVDAQDRLWLLDTGRIRSGPAGAGAAKLVAVDLASGAVVNTIIMPPEQVGPDSYLNDVRLDLSQGTEGVAYLTDSSRGGILVVDIGTGAVMRRLEDHPSGQPQDVELMVEGEPFCVQPSPNTAPTPVKVAADGIALSPKGDMLYYCPLTSRRLYGIPTAALRDPALDEAALGAQVKALGPKPAVDGMAMDQAGRLYLAAFEHNAVMCRLPDGTFRTIAQNARLLWPDSIAIGPDACLYVTASQLHRQAQFHGGQDLRQRPFAIFRIKLEAAPALPQQGS